VITSDGIGKWAAKKRYSELWDLHNMVLTMFDTDGPQLTQRYPLQNLPPFPPKKWVGSMESSFLSTRAVQLNVYFRALAEAMVHDGHSEDADYCLFFDAFNPVHFYTCLHYSDIHTPI
jgi:hypothetical protein